MLHKAELENLPDNASHLWPKPENITIYRGKPSLPDRPPKFRERLVRRSPVTIAIGFRSNDGVVLCADTELSIGEVKAYDGKVATHIMYEKGGDYRLVFAIAGAGDLDYINTAKSHLTREFPEYGNGGEVRIELERRWLEFFNKHLLPWASFSSNDRPHVELLIAVSGTKAFPTLYHCVGTAFQETSAKAIGSGVLLASDLINRYAFGNYKVQDNVVLATYIIAKVKRGVQYCGGSTHMTSLRKNGDFAFSGKDEMERLEQSLLDEEQTADKNLVKNMLQHKIALPWFSESRSKAKKLKSNSATTTRPQLEQGRTENH